jgi:hypothetical protein
LILADMGTDVDRVMVRLLWYESAVAIHHQHAFYVVGKVRLGHLEETYRVSKVWYCWSLMRERRSRYHDSGNRNGPVLAPSEHNHSIQRHGNCLGLGRNPFEASSEG